MDTIESQLVFFKYYCNDWAGKYLNLSSTVKTLNPYPQAIFTIQSVTEM